MSNEKLLMNILCEKFDNLFIKILYKIYRNQRL